MKQHSNSIAALVVLLGLSTPLAAQDVVPASYRPAPLDSQSAAAASALVALLDQHKLDAIAARDPDQPGQALAAMYISGTQLLVISAPYPAALLDKRLAERKFMDVYLDANAVATHEGHFFVMDLLADGLRSVCDRDQPFDSTSRNGGKSMSFDGNWMAQELTEPEYNARFQEDDVRYARILGILAGAVTQPAAGARKGTN